MSFDDLAQLSGKRAVQIIELYMDKCTRTYGVAPCTASVPTTGTQKCFNTFGTCQDTVNFDKTLPSGQIIYRFSTSRIDGGLQAVGDPPIFPTLVNVDTAPTVLTPGEGLGVRASISATVADHPYTDVFIDPYLSTRSYVPDNQGTFWGKFLRRNQYYENRRIDVLTGFLNDDGSYSAANFKRRTYIIEKISGPGPRGTVSISGKDPLKLADGDKTKWPAASTSKLSTSYLAAATSLVITDPDGTVAAQLAVGVLAQPYLKIDKEIVQVTAITNPSPLTVTVVRGPLAVPTFYNQTLNQAGDLAADTTVFLTWLWEDAYIYDIVYYLLNDVVGIDPTYLPLTDWTNEIQGGFQYMKFDTLLTQSDSVKNYLVELTQLGVMIWWDDEAAEVKMKGLRFSKLLGTEITDANNIIADSVEVVDDTDKLITQSWIYYGLSYPMSDMKLLQSYRFVNVQIDVNAESDEAYGRPTIRSVFSRWLSPNDTGIAVNVNALMIRQYATVRKTITFDLDPKDDLRTIGETIGVTTKYVQDESGAAAVKNYLIIQKQEMLDNGLKYRYTASEQFNFTRTGLITYDPPNPLAPPVYSSASNDQKNTWGFISANSAPFFFDNTTAYQIV